MIYSRFWQLAAGVLLIFIVAAACTTTETLAETLRYIGVFLDTTICLTFSRAAWRVSMKRHQTASDYLILGVFISWTMQMGLCIWVLLWRISDQPPWMVNNDFSLIFVVGINFAGALHLLTSNAINGEQVPRSKSVLIALLVSAGILMSMVMFGSKTQVKAFVEHIRPFFELLNHNID